MENNDATDSKVNAFTLSKYLSPLGGWALSFGTAVGWGSFAMPSEKFLPYGGPLGTLLGFLIGMFVFFIFSINYHYLNSYSSNNENKNPLTRNLLGYDYAFLNRWFLVLSYIAIIWANSTALSYLGKHFFGDLFQFGYIYGANENSIYIGEVLLSVSFLLVTGFICLKSNKLAINIQIISSIILFTGIIICFFVSCFYHQGGFEAFKPYYVPDNNIFKQIFTILMIAPWAFVGFESINYSSPEFNFSNSKSLKIMFIAIAMSTISYILLTYIAISVLPENFTDWFSYISFLKASNGLKGSIGLPTLYSIEALLGMKGVILLAITALCGIITGLIGSFIASSRLIYLMANQEMLPNFFKTIGKDNTPFNAILFIIGISIIIPFVQKTAIGWVVDITTFGAALTYGYISLYAFKSATIIPNTKIKITGLIGIVFSVLFALYVIFPNLSSISSFSKESYFIIAFWSIVGLVFFRKVFTSHLSKELSKSNLIWILLLFLVFFTSQIWINQSTNTVFQEVLKNVKNHYNTMIISNGIPLSNEENLKNNQLIDIQIQSINKVMVLNSFIQLSLVVFTLILIFNIYTVSVFNLTHNKVLADQSCISRIMLNIISNSLKFTPEHGSISVTLLEDSFEGNIGNYIIKIKDNGIGISEEFLPRIFEAFEKERSSTDSGVLGTGLGLAITKSLITLMNGKIEVNTKLNLGSEFIISLPLTIIEDAKEEVKENPISEKDFSKMKILLVEDILINREIALMLLKEMGFKVDTAENGKIALDKIIKSEPDEYSAILMDIQMPVINGYEATKAIRALQNPKLSKIPIIAVTANVLPEDLQAAIESGMDGYIAKPIDVTTMKKTLDNILGMKS